MINVNHVSFKYEGHEETEDVLHDVSFHVERGSFVSILGHNGSGKSTLAKLLNAIYVPKSGDITIAGMSTADTQNLWAIREKAGIVFQNPDNQIVATIVEEDVAFGPENLGIPSHEIKERVQKALKTVGMEDYAKRQPHQLSGGQKQRVAIAGVLAMRPDCIIFDEPTAMLDPVGRKEVIETILDLNKNQGITVLLITHFMEEALLSDEIIVLSGGRIVKSGPPRAVFSDVEGMQSYQLDVPYGAHLAHKLKTMGLKLPDGLLTTEELLKVLETLPIKGDCPKHILPKNQNPPDSQIVIQSEALNYTYNPQSIFEVKALDSVNLSIHNGAFIGLIGHTGSGKSTLIQQLNGLLKPSSGKLTILGTDITVKGARMVELRKRVGLVFQYPEYQLFEETVYKDIAYGPSHLGLSETEIDKRVSYAMALVGLSDPALLEKSPFELSGGQKRRVAIAGILAMKPEILILDEPTAGLDPKGRRDILKAIQEIHRQEKITVILVSHSMEDIAQMVEKIIVMDRGRVIHYDDPSHVFEDASHLNAVGLDLPVVTKVIQALNVKGFQLNPHHFDMDQLSEEIVARLGVVSC